MTSANDQRLFKLTRVFNALVVAGLLFSGVVAFQFVASPQVEKGGVLFTVVTGWLLVTGLAAVVLGAMAMGRAPGASVERARSWYAMAFGLVALSMGAAFGVGFL